MRPRSKQQWHEQEYFRLAEMHSEAHKQIYIPNRFVYQLTLKRVNTDRSAKWFFTHNWMGTVIWKTAH